MFEEVTSTSDLLGGKAILAWVSYPFYGQNPYCFVYPQWVQKGSRLYGVNPAAAPDRGVVYVSIQGDDNAETIQSKYGEIVVVTVNAKDIRNTKYDAGESEDQLFAMLNERWTNSQIEFARLDSHSLGRDLIQIVELNDSGADLSSPLSSAVGLKTDPVTSMVMVEKPDGFNLVYYGPFYAQPVAPGEYELSAVSDFRNMVHRLDSSEIGDVVTVNRGHDAYGAAAKFVYKPNINSYLNSPKGRTAIDWMTDDELIAAISNVITNTRSLKVKKEDIRAIKKAVSSCNMDTARIYPTEQRTRRMNELLSEPELWADKLDVLAAALVKPEVSEWLVKLALSPEFFPQTKSLFVNSEEIQRQIDAENQKLYAETERARRAAEDATAARSEAERKLKEAEEQAQEIQDKALADVRGQLERAEADLAVKSAEIAAAEESLAALERQAGEIVERLDSSADEVVGSISRNRVMRRIAGDLPASPSGGQRAHSPALASPQPRDGEAEMAGASVVSALHEQISTRAGRDMDESQVVNLLTCLMGSSITVLSGLPGTGKTSLAGILAGALGLVRPEAPRFTKISVERGWASHRDYIGYYNPLTRTLEASNTEVFEAMTSLDAELRGAEAADGVVEAAVPYLFLLDEANLSVVENYWSPFLGNADDFLSTPTTLSMQGGDSLRIPPNVRWVATVNYDHTTEALSERFLNRAWVVNMDGDSLSIDDLLDSSDACDFSKVAPFSYGKLLEVFGPREGARIDDLAAKKLLVGFFEKCRRAGHPVSYRCQRAIARYVASAEPLMREFEGSAGILAVDFALSQRVLPSVNGVGEDVRSLLVELGAVSPALRRTNARIERMLKAGDADGFYQFFA